jgi:hypothetical protein
MMSFETPLLHLPGLLLPLPSRPAPSVKLIEEVMAKVFACSSLRCKRRVYECEMSKDDHRDGQEEGPSLPVA